MKIEIKTNKVTKRKTDCPIISNLYDDYDYEGCKKCKYFVNGDCITEEYVVKEFKKDSETEDDEYGGMPVTDYWWIFPCAKCGKDIEEHSGMSSIGHLDTINCENCDTPHTLIKGGYCDGVFLIPKLGVQ